MSLVTLYSGGNEASGEVVAARTWNLPASGQAGQASLPIPYASPLADIVDQRAGMTVLIHDADGSGEWNGYVVDAEWGANGITLSALQDWSIIGRRIVTLTGIRTAVQPGFIVTEALKDTCEVLGLTVPDAPFDGDSPLIDLWNWDLQDAWSVISDMMGRSANELWIDPETREIVWTGPLAGTEVYDETLIAGQSLRGWSLRESNADRVSEVIGGFSSVTDFYGGWMSTFNTYGTFVYSAYHGEGAVAGIPAQASVGADSPAAVRDAAHAELNLRSAPAIAISGSLSRDHMAIRERNLADVFIPRKGMTYTCRVLSRTVDDAADDIGVELLAMPVNAIATTVKPLAWASRDAGRGTGSVAQRLVRANRRMGRTG